MRSRDAMKLHNGDEVTVKKTKEVATVLSAYKDGDGNVTIEATYHGFTKFSPREIG